MVHCRKCGQWSCTSDGPILSSDQVHIWSISYEWLGANSTCFAQTISWDERARAERYRFLEDRSRFVIRRGILRMILGRYLSVEPSHIKLDYGPYGKPHLAGEFDSDSLQFSLAYSHELVVYAFARKCQVGIDVERIQPLPDIEQISAQFFTTRENRKINELDGLAKLLAFYHCWTRKEAYVKAIGAGLTYPMNQLEVSVDPNEPAQLLWAEKHPQAATQWSLKSFAPADDYVSALAIKGHQWHFVQVNAISHTRQVNPTPAVLDSQ